MKKHLKSYLILFLAAAVIVALDQWTKYLVRTNIPLGEAWMPLAWLAPYARIVHWYNTGVAFGMFQGSSPIFAVLSLAISVGIIFYYPRIDAKDWVLRAAFCLELGGAIGNLIDRALLGQVTDFISVGTFPVFNIADSCITVGVAVLLLGVWLEERREKQAKLAEKTEEKPATPEETGAL